MAGPRLRTPVPRPSRQRLAAWRRPVSATSANGGAASRKRDGPDRCMRFPLGNWLGLCNNITSSGERRERSTWVRAAVEGRSGAAEVRATGRGAFRLTLPAAPSYRAPPSVAPGGPERARSSAGEHSLHTGGVTGSIPVAPTTFKQLIWRPAPFSTDASSSNARHVRQPAPTRRARPRPPAPPEPFRHGLMLVPGASRSQIVASVTVRFPVGGGLFEDDGPE